MEKVEILKKKLFFSTESEDINNIFKEELESIIQENNNRNRTVSEMCGYCIPQLVIPADGL